MNQKKAKHLRRECKGIPLMTQIIPTEDVISVMKNKKTGEVKRVKRTPLDGIRQRVNHYRNAKKRFKGSVQKAVRAAIRHAEVMESIGVYKYK